MNTIAASAVQSIDWLAIAPPTITAVLGLVVLVADLFLAERHKPLLGWVSVAGLAIAGLSLLPLRDGDRTTFCLVSDGNVCSYVADDFTIVIQLLVLGGALLTALLSVHAVAELKLPAGEYWFLLLSSAAGAALLPASRDLATLVIALEVASLPAFALVGLRRGDRLAAEAALKFFLSSVAATAVTLLGVSFVYATTGSMHVAEIADGLTHVDSRLETLAQAGVALTLIGFAFKTAAVPFHFWVPDTYVGAPLPVAAYLSVIGKAVGFTGLIVVTVRAFPSYADVWGPAMAALAALTMTVGNVAALRQRPDRAHSAVRLLAWSSVGQAGYLLVPIAAAGYADSTAEAEHAIGATVAYALMYAAVNLGAFAVVALVAQTTQTAQPVQSAQATHTTHTAQAAQTGQTAQPAHATETAEPAQRSNDGAGHRLTDHRALYATHPLAALSLGFFLLCLAGLPPGVIGLFAKVTVFSAVVDAGLGWLAVVMAVNVVIALYYYLQWTAALFRAPTAVPATVPTAASAAPSSAGEASAAGEPVPVSAAVPEAQVVSGTAPGPRVDVGTLASGTPGTAAHQAAHRGARTGESATDAVRPRVPAPLAATVALTAAIAVALSGAPQLVLRFASGTLF
ncbi:NADH-quinone oxidoreductase subunit N [Streptomyces zagrosensis]|uniref:NADH-quinone oxidoreductase subunit N n=1 Tax=Streptomyces zagrosensis TaxID=1042984 RepID=A0A7W9QF74_9ACTN|nr:NADH-quinone oxidoreductase subunit N [Streptomyces zagrosensis]MBB5938112.1 NADH-quinone oxidoreductase subunit N [Streptomyces zagrosensis]